MYIVLLCDALVYITDTLSLLVDVHLICDKYILKQIFVQMSQSLAIMVKFMSRESKFVIMHTLIKY